MRVFFVFVAKELQRPLVADCRQLRLMRLSLEFGPRYLAVEVRRECAHKSVDVPVPSVPRLRGKGSNRSGSVLNLQKPLVAPTRRCYLAIKHVKYQLVI